MITVPTAPAAAPAARFFPIAFLFIGPSSVKPFGKCISENWTAPAIIQSGELLENGWENIGRVELMCESSGDQGAYERERQVSSVPDRAGRLDPSPANAGSHTGVLTKPYV